ELLPAWCRRVSPLSDIGSTYPAFIHWLQSLPPYDIGLAPLVDNEFNRAKSPIKYLDYAALGMAVVCSDLEPYREIVCHEENGLVVPMIAGAWYQALRRLMIDPVLRCNLQVAARQTLLGVGTLAAQRQTLQLALEYARTGQSVTLD